jgi:alpha-amylase
MNQNFRFNSPKQFSNWIILVSFCSSKIHCNYFSGLTNLGPGYGYGNFDDFNVVNFIDNHDNQRSEPPNVVIYKDGTPYKLAVGFMLAWPYGLPRVMSSYYFSTHDQGPPHLGGPYFNVSKSCSVESF